MPRIGLFLADTMSNTEKLPMPLQLAAATVIITSAIALMQLGFILQWFWLHRSEVSIWHGVSSPIHIDMLCRALFIGFGLITVHAIYYRSLIVGAKFALAFLALLFANLAWSVGSIVTSGMGAHFENLSIFGKIIFPVTRIGFLLWLILLARAVIPIALNRSHRDRIR